MSIPDLLKKGISSDNDPVQIFHISKLLILSNLLFKRESIKTCVTGLRGQHNLPLPSSLPATRQSLLLISLLLMPTTCFLYSILLFFLFSLHMHHQLITEYRLSLQTTEDRSASAATLYSNSIKRLPVLYQVCGRTNKQRDINFLQQLRHSVVTFIA